MRIIHAGRQRLKLTEVAETQVSVRFEDGDRPVRAGWGVSGGVWIDGLVQEDAAAPGAFAGSLRLMLSADSNAGSSGRDPRGSEGADSQRDEVPARRRVGRCHVVRVEFASGSS